MEQYATPVIISSAEVTHLNKQSWRTARLNPVSTFHRAAGWRQLSSNLKPGAPVDSYLKCR